MPRDAKKANKRSKTHINGAQEGNRIVIARSIRADWKTIILVTRSNTPGGELSSPFAYKDTLTIHLHYQGRGDRNPYLSTRGLRARAVA
jgi:hypothetical protein